MRISSGSLYLKHSGFCGAPTFLLGVWNFDMCQEEGAYATSPQWKLHVPEYWLSFPGKQPQNSSKKSADRSRDGKSGCTEKRLRWLLKKREVSNYLNRVGWAEMLLTGCVALPVSSFDQSHNSESMSWCPRSVSQISRNSEVAIKLLLICLVLLQHQAVTEMTSLQPESIP